MDRQRRPPEQSTPEAPEPAAAPRRRAAPAGPDRHPELVARVGDEGEAVEETKGHLRKLGYEPGDGPAFDADTEQAVRAFGRDYGLGDDGDVVELSLGVMREVAARLPPVSAEKDDHNPIERLLVDAAASVDMEAQHAAYSKGPKAAEWRGAKATLARAAEAIGSFSFSEGDACLPQDVMSLTGLQDALGLLPTGELDAQTLELAARWGRPGAEKPDPAVLAAEREGRAVSHLVDADAVAKEHAEGAEPPGFAEQKRTVSAHLRMVQGVGLTDGPGLTPEDVLAVARFQARVGLSVTGRVDAATLDEAQPMTFGALRDPELHTDRREEARQGISEEVQAAAVTKIPAHGALFQGEPTPDDVIQGATGDCWFVAALASVAAQEPALIRSMIADNGDGTYTVTLHRRELVDGQATFHPVRIRVDGDLYMRNGKELYAKAPRGADGRKVLWSAIYEKALVQFASQYGKDGTDERSGEDPASYQDVYAGPTKVALELITGRQARVILPKEDSDPEEIYRQIQEGLDAGSGVALTVGGGDDPKAPEPPAFIKGRAPTFGTAPDRNAPDYLESLAAHIEQVNAAEYQTHVLPRAELTPEQRAEYSQYQRDVIVFREQWETLGETMKRYKPVLDKGVVIHHAHSILGTFRVGDRMYVELRNPHGHGEPSGGGADDGRYVLEMKDFLRAAGGVSFGGAPPGGRGTPRR